MEKSKISQYLEYMLKCWYLRYLGLNIENETGKKLFLFTLKVFQY